MQRALQASIWGHEAKKRGKATAVRNKIGPYAVREEALADIQLLRVFRCNDYDCCLTFAARHNWESFTCKGCRKAEILRGYS